MKNRHKYFRNQRYRAKLENKYDGSHIYNGIVVLTKEPATNQPIELDWYGNAKGPDYYYDRNRNRYEYFSPIVKPDVSYTVLKICYVNRGNNYKTWLKKFRNRQFRHNNKNWVSSERRSYQKLYEYWWDID